MSYRHTLKAALKRGALVAAANWPVALVQSTADGLFKLLLAVPLVGGVVLVTLVIGADTSSLMTADWRVLIASVVGSLLAHRVVLAAFLLSLAVVAVGGSIFVFLIKGGTIGILVDGERKAGPVETPPLHLETIATAGAFSIERFIESARALWPRYTRLGFALMGVYVLSAVVFVLLLIAASRPGMHWLAGTMVTATFAIWITVVNFLYLLVQIVVAAEDCRVGTATRRVTAFLRGEPRLVLGVFVTVLALVVLATVASLLAFTALGLIFLIPFVSLAAIPLQLIAVVLRAIVFQYIGLSAVGAYLKLYRERSAFGPSSAGASLGEPLTGLPSGPASGTL